MEVKVANQVEVKKANKEVMEVKEVKPAVRKQERKTNIMNELR